MGANGPTQLRATDGHNNIPALVVSAVANEALDPVLDARAGPVRCGRDHAGCAIRPLARDRDAAPAGLTVGTGAPWAVDA
jgi:hypothetical protein